MILRNKCLQARREHPIFITYQKSQTDARDKLYDLLISKVDFLQAEGESSKKLKKYTHELLYTLVTGGVNEKKFAGCPTECSLIISSLRLDSATGFRSASEVTKICSTYQYLMRSVLVHQSRIDTDEVQVYEPLSGLEATSSSSAAQTGDDICDSSDDFTRPVKSHPYLFSY